MNSFQNLDTAKAIQLWMSGTYSFTILEIAKIESVLGEKIINF